MPHPEGVAQWTETLASALPVLSAAPRRVLSAAPRRVLSAAPRRVLAQWCFALEETGLCATHTVAVFLGLALGGAWQTVRQRLREWYWDAADKQGLNRQEVEVLRRWRAGCCPTGPARAWPWRSMPPAWGTA